MKGAVSFIQERRPYASADFDILPKPSIKKDKFITAFQSR